MTDTTSALVTRGTGNAASYLLVGPVHKGEQATSGILRDWPLAPDFARFVERQAEYVKLTEGPDFRFLWRSHDKVSHGRTPVRSVGKSLVSLVERVGAASLLAGTSCHHHRFRKTTARLIVIALHGGPTILRRLFRHETLGVTLRYILVNDTLIEEMREIAREEERILAERLVVERNSLRGGGADSFRLAVEALLNELDVTVPFGKREQARFTTFDVLDVLQGDGSSFAIKQIVPGLISCYVPRGEAGLCSQKNQLPNIARCDSRCRWHLAAGEFVTQARVNVGNALKHLAAHEPGSFAWLHYADVVRGRLRDFPELTIEYAGDDTFETVMRGGDAEGR